MKITAVRKVIDQLRQRRLRSQYAAAFTEFADSGDAAIWDSTVGDA